MNDAILQVENLSKKYPNGTQAVRGVSFEVKKGEIFGILGPNGAGKTTTLETLETLHPISSGRAMICGIDVSKEPEAVKRVIGVQPQSSGFQDKTTLTELLQLFGACYGEKADTDSALRDVGLHEKKGSYIENLSGGQRQRFSIAAALIHEPKVFFMDEPTTGLDPQARRNLWNLVKKIRERGITMVLTTHYMDEAEVLCDRVAVMDEGKILVEGSPKKLIKDLLDRGFQKKQRVEQADLEDVFIDLTGHELKDI